MLLNLLGLFQSKDFISVDFSGSSVKVARASVQDNSLSLSMTDKQAVRGMDDSNKIEKYTEALREIKTRNAISNRENVVFSLPTNSVIVRHVELPSMPNQRLSEVIKYEAESHIPFPIDDVNLDYHVLEETDEGTRVLLVVVKNEKLEKYLEVLRNVELRPEMVDISAFSLFNLYQKLKPPEDEEEESPPKVLVDIGHENTDIIIFQGETLYYARSASVAGKSMTEAVSEQLEVDLEQAEELKVEYGNLPLSEASPEDPGAPATPTSESPPEEDSASGEESPPAPPDSEESDGASEPPSPPATEQSDEDLTMDQSEESSSEAPGETKPPPPPGSTEQQPETPEDLESPSPESESEGPSTESSPSSEVTEESEQGMEDSSIEEPPEPPGPPDSDSDESVAPPESPAESDAEDPSMDFPTEESGLDAESAEETEDVVEPPDPPPEGTDSETSRPDFLDEDEEEDESESVGESTGVEEASSSDSTEEPPSELDLDTGSEPSSTKPPDPSPGESGDTADPTDESDSEGSGSDLSLDSEADTELSKSEAAEDSGDLGSPESDTGDDFGLEQTPDETLEDGPGSEDTLDTAGSSGETLQDTGGEESLDLSPGGPTEPPKESDETDDDEAIGTPPGSAGESEESPAMEPDSPESTSESDESPPSLDEDDESETAAVGEPHEEEAEEDSEPADIDDEMDEKDAQDDEEKEEDDDEIDDLPLGERRTPDDDVSDSDEEDNGPPGIGAAANENPGEPPSTEYDEEALQDALRSQADRLINELQQTFDYFQNEMDGDDVGEIILCGSGCKLNNLPAYIENELDRETRRFDPLAKMKGLGVDELQSMLVVAGLQLRSVPADSVLSINLLPQEILRRRERKKRNQKLIANGVLAGILVLQVLVWLFYSYRVRKNHYLQSQNQLDKVQPIVERVEELNKTQEELQKRIAVIDDLEKRQGRILPILHGLNQLPDNLKNRTWFENFSISDNDPYPTLNLDGITGDFQDTSRIYGWFQERDFVVRIEDQNQGRITRRINDEDRSMVRFSVNSSITFNSTDAGSDTDADGSEGDG